MKQRKYRKEENIPISTIDRYINVSFVQPERNLEKM